MTLRIRHPDSQDSRPTTSLKERIAKIDWTPRLVSLVISVVSLQLVVVRPLLSRISRLENQSRAVNNTLNELSGAGDGVEQTTNLLSELRAQQSTVSDAHDAVQKMAELRRRIMTESAKVPEALDAVDRIAQLPKHVLEKKGRQETKLIPPQFARTSVEPPLLKVPHEKPLSTRKPWQIEVRPASTGRESSQSSEIRPGRGPELDSNRQIGATPVPLNDWFARLQ